MKDQPYPSFRGVIIIGPEIMRVNDNTTMDCIGKLAGVNQWLKLACQADARTFYLSLENKRLTSF
jgi:hypothetical protein